MDLTKKLDEVFSIFVRLRYADYRDFVHCFTCTWYGHWRECDCGHWIKRGNEAVRWDKDNARPQCVDCNRYGDGKVNVFEQELREEIGDDAVDALKTRSVKDRYLNEEEKSELLVHIKNLVKELGFAV